MAETLRVPIEHLHTRLTQEAALVNLTPDAYTLSALHESCGITVPNPATSVQVILASPTGMRKPVVVVTGPLVSSLILEAKKRGTAPRKYVVGQLAAAIEAPYQRSVWDI
jgi:hypothetical protein